MGSHRVGHDWSDLAAAAASMYIYLSIYLLLVWKLLSCVTLCDPVDYSLPGSSVHGILQARILEWVTISFSRGSSRPRDQTQVSFIAGRFFTVQTTREAPIYDLSLRLWFFQCSCMDVRVGMWRKLSAEELMLLNCGVGEDSWESLRLQGDSTSPFWRSALGFLWKEWC